MTTREKERLMDLLAKWSEENDPPLEGKDRDAIAWLRFLLESDLDPE